MSSAEGSADFKVVGDLSSLRAGCQAHVRLRAGLSHYLHVNIRDIVNRKRLTLLCVKEAAAVLHHLTHPLINVLQVLLLIFVVGGSQELIVLFVDVELKRVLVVGE